MRRRHGFIAMVHASKSPMSPFLFAFAVWGDRANISRSDYAALLEVIQLARDTPEVWEQLPLPSADTDTSDI